MESDATRVRIPDDIRNTVNGAISGLHRLIDTEVIPIEHAMGDKLTDERKFFDESGKAREEILQAQRHIRMRCAAGGYYGMFAPKSVGGGELGARVRVFVQEAMYRKYGPGRPLVTWAKGFLSQPTIASFDVGPSHMLVGVSDSVREQFVAPVARGEKTVCIAQSEINAGSDIWSIKTNARRQGENWVINGRKHWVTNAPYADYAVVFAVTDERLLKERKGGVTAFFVETGVPGYSFGGILPIMGHAGGDCGAMIFDDVRIPADRVIGSVNKGFEIAMLGILEGRISISANCIGMCEYALDRSIEHVRERMALTQHISEQAIQLMLADIAIDIFTMKYMVLQTAALIENSAMSSNPPLKEIAIAKVYSVRKALACYDRAIQIHGAIGLTNQLRLNEGFRLARTLRIPEGTDEIQRRSIARQMLLGSVLF